jgi:transposase-like protein
VFEEELAAFPGRLRYDRGEGARKGYRHGHRERQLTGTFGTETVRVPRARIGDEDRKVAEWRSKALPRYRRLTRKAEALIAAIHLVGTGTRRVKRALAGLFDGAVGKDVVSRASRQRRGAAQRREVKVDRKAWCARSLADEEVVRLVLDGTVIRTRPDRKATTISVPAAIGVRRDGETGIAVHPQHGRREPVFDLATPHRGLASGFAGAVSTVAAVPRRPRCPRPRTTRVRDRRSQHSPPPAG